MPAGDCVDSHDGSYKADYLNGQFGSSGRTLLDRCVGIEMSEQPLVFMGNFLVFIDGCPKQKAVSR